MEEILRVLPENIKQAIIHHTISTWDELEEIRLRLNKPVELNFHHQIIWVDHVFTAQDSLYVLNQLSEHSLYRLEDELHEGFITIPGGHRVGLAGAVTTVNGEMKQLQHITFYNIRIAREIKQIAAPFISYLKNERSYYNTLIIGPPQTGKTTFIRDLARLISDKADGFSPLKVGVIDERSEIAASRNGIPQHNVGLRTDVMDACPKVAGLMMMIRSMSPDVLIADEIGKKEEVTALMEAVFAGVSIICTAHAFSVNDLKQRPSMKILFDHHVFERFIILERHSSDFFKINIETPDSNLLTSDLVMKR